MMKSKKILSIVLMIALIFIGKIEIKAQNFSLSKTCNGDPYYFKFIGEPTSAQQNYIFTVSEWTANINQYHDTADFYDRDTELAALANCSTDPNQYCVRADTCMYYVDTQRVFCLDAETHFAAGSTVDYTVAGSTVTNQGMACALIELYDKLKFDNNGNVKLNEISESDMHAIQKKMWSHQYDNKDCTSAAERTVTQQKDGKVQISSSTSGSDFTYVQGLGFVSKKITITADYLKGGTSIGLNLTGAPNGTIISSSNSSKVAVENVSSGTNVYIIAPQIPASQGIKLTATAQVEASTSVYITSTFTEYTSSYSQKMGIPNLTREFENSYLTKSADITLSLPNGSIVITKKNSNNGFTLEGAQFSISYNGNSVYDIYGNRVDPKTTDEDGKVTFANLPAGVQYTITEVAAPQGYYITTPSQTVTLNNQTVSIDWMNAPRNVLISKKDITSEDEVLGAHIQVYKYHESTRTKGDLYDDFLSNTVAHNKYYDAGKYVMIETLPASGYKMVKTAFVFNVSDDDVVTLRAVGEFDDDDKFVAFTDTTERQNAERYVDVDGNNITLYNELMEVTISKKDITGKKELAGAKIKITNDKDPQFKIEFISKENEETKVNLEYLEPQGTKKYYYYMEETIAPKGYKKITTVFKFSIDEYGTPKLVSIGSWDNNGKFTNEKKVTTHANVNFKNDEITLLDEPIKIIFAKKDSSTSKHIKGAHIKITPENSNGKTIEFDTISSEYELDLEPGIYYIKETKAAEGYQELNIEYKIQITEEKNIRLLSENADNISIKDNTIIIYNTLVPVESTGIDISPLTYAGVGLLIIAGIVLIVSVKKRNAI